MLDLTGLALAWDMIIPNLLYNQLLFECTLHPSGPIKADRIPTYGVIKRL